MDFKNKKTIHYIVMSLGLGIAFFVMFEHIIGLFVGAAVGVTIPRFMEKAKASSRRKKFSKQIPDAVMLITSCLKAGLSLNQSIDVLVEEMNEPISEEFSHVAKSLRIGVSLENAFVEMGKRLDLEELNFVCSAILIARETGGDLPKVLTKLVDTLRDRAKLKESIDTFTIQGRAQAFIMGVIPIGFVAMTIQQDPHHFDIMLKTDIGRILIVAAILLQIIAVFVIIKTSQVKI